MNLLDPIKKIVADPRDYLMSRAVIGQAFDGLLKYLALKESDIVVRTFSAGTTGFTPNVPTSGNVTLAGVLSAANGGTGLTGPFANGQILIGNGSGFTAATITAGPGISVTNGPGSITITNTGGGGGGVTVTGRTGDINVVTSGTNYEVQNAVLPFLLMGC